MTVMMPEVQLLPLQFPVPIPTLLEDMSLHQKLFRTNFGVPKTKKMTVMMPEVQCFQFPSPNQILLEDM